MVASTGNSMISRQAVRRLGLEFDTSLALAGGEDTLFFLQAGRGGIETAFAADAVAHEQVVPGRLTLWRLLRRQFRFGNTLSICDLALGASLGERSVRLAKGCALIGQGLLLLPLAPFRGMGGLAHALGRLARGLGTLTGLAGHRFEEYRRDRNLDV